MDLLHKQLSETVTVMDPGEDHSGRKTYFSYVLPAQNI